MGDYGVRTGYARVAKNLVFSGLWCFYGFWTMFYGVPTGFLRDFTVFLWGSYGFLLFPHLKSVNFFKKQFSQDFWYISQFIELFQTPLAKEVQVEWPTRFFSV